MTPSGPITHFDPWPVAAREAGAPAGSSDNPAPTAFSEPMAMALAHLNTAGAQHMAGESSQQALAGELPVEGGALPESGKTSPEARVPGELDRSEPPAFSHSPTRSRARLRSDELDSGVGLPIQTGPVPLATLMGEPREPKDSSSGGSPIRDLPRAAPPLEFARPPGAGYNLDRQGDPFAASTKSPVMFDPERVPRAPETVTTPSVIAAARAGKNPEFAHALPFDSTDSVVARSGLAGSVLDAPRQQTLEPAGSLLDSQSQGPLEQSLRSQLETRDTGSPATTTGPRDAAPTATANVVGFSNAEMGELQSESPTEIGVDLLNQVAANGRSERPVDARASAPQTPPVEGLPSAGVAPAPDGVDTARARPGAARQLSRDLSVSAAGTSGDSTVGNATPLARVGQIEPQPMVAPSTDSTAASLGGLPVEDTIEKSIARHVAWMTRTGLNEAELRLDPQELGSLQIRVTVRDDQASVSFAATESSVREVLQEQVGRLRELLGEQGLSLAESNVGNGYGSEHADSAPERRHGSESELAGTDDTALHGSAEQSSQRTGGIDAYA